MDFLHFVAHFIFGRHFGCTLNSHIRVTTKCKHLWKSHHEKEKESFHCNLSSNKLNCWSPHRTRHIWLQKYLILFRSDFKFIQYLDLDFPLFGEVLIFGCKKMVDLIILWEIRGWPGSLLLLFWHQWVGGHHGGRTQPHQWVGGHSTRRTPSWT